MSTKKLGSGATVRGEAVREAGGKNIHVRRKTVVEKIPDHIDLVFATGSEEWAQSTEIVAASTIDQRPPHRFTSGEDTNVAQPAVVRIGVTIVMSGCDLVDPFAPFVVTRGAFETGEKEAAKHRSFHVLPFAAEVAPTEIEDSSPTASHPVRTS